MTKLRQFSQQDLHLIKEETVYKGHFELKKMYFRHKLFSGEMSGEIVRELLIKGAAAALIAYDPVRDSVVLVEQVRIGAYDPKSDASPWLLELVAGMVDKGNEDPAEVAIREAQEEAGLVVNQVEHALSIWDSPGGQLERLHLFLGLIDSSTVQSGARHGLEEEGEDILVHVVSREQAYQWVCEGKIDNVIAVVGLQWLQLNYQKYRV
ncbi:ADP-ribose diphosphatase [Actinobacillus pleuropneumoniae]|uniref:ADP-ribose pyrophosphatase n=1 Tax=Actinobacillus pleuropneumoniae serotype 3 (strain JL03) TaxID=434271 RepID=B0BTX0_ACTPJ|nr:ADP-ribose diphosphatase [Actinobacillus pleuropneumoniae]ABY70537.1 putative ADP-ribose pyrophosphatase [Actinobacillus pleuropneumoniae serovar 3 str. JL03]MBT9318767.1 ADP-ribose diphosphatase [Actinobacillus pleuropneumoniae]MBT9343541.1 ADP-ribose diphosphatase [Actinobacillus pleuropneumoniae]UKH15440.1 ADP-ribose diphosphatase [Actinobacillus pleuropneumoniae]UKH44616.1 ADP-ribose diphosphatase [Actinobacillus pleuropneumoniae]